MIEFLKKVNGPIDVHTVRVTDTIDANLIQLYIYKDLPVSLVLEQWMFRL